MLVVSSGHYFSISFVCVCVCVLYIVSNMYYNFIYEFLVYVLYAKINTIS